MKEKTSGTKDPRREADDGAADENGPVIEVARDGTARMREDEEGADTRPSPQTGPAVADEDPDYSPMDEAQGRKTREQFKRTLEKKPDVPKPDDIDAHPERSHGRAPRDRSARQSEMPVSRHGMNQEDRQHNHKAPR